VTVLTSVDFKKDVPETETLHFLRLETVREEECMEMKDEVEGDAVKW